MPSANAPEAPAQRPLTRSDYKTLSLSALGGALEFYDFIIFVFFATVVGKLFFPADMPEWLRQLQTFGLFAAGYLARPLGGVIMAHFGDLLGRKRMFTLSIFMMAVPTLIMGLLPTYAQIGIWAPLAVLRLRPARRRASCWARWWLLRSIASIARQRCRTTPGGFPSCSAGCSACSRSTCAAGCTRRRYSPSCSSARRWQRKCR
ncbi:Proline/betaine transporter [Pseudomonas aeruginosa]|nr:Proline/betaine transporter [Pseudomonas aeruginosa]